jgi:hypothetical protein
MALALAEPKRVHAFETLDELRECFTQTSFGFHPEAMPPAFVLKGMVRQRGLYGPGYWTSLVEALLLDEDRETLEEVEHTLAGDAHSRTPPALDLRAYPSAYVQYSYALACTRACALPTRLPIHTHPHTRSHSPRHTHTCTAPTQQPTHVTPRTTSHFVSTSHHKTDAVVHKHTTFAQNKQHVHATLHVYNVSAGAAQETLIIIGDRDCCVSPAAVGALAERAGIPCTRLVDTGHVGGPNGSDFRTSIFTLAAPHVRTHLLSDAPAAKL